MARIPPILLRDSVPAASVRLVPPGSRAMIDWSQMPRDSDAMAIETVSGWIVALDYRKPLAGFTPPETEHMLLLEGKDWRGDVRTMPISNALVRVSSALGDR